MTITNIIVCCRNEALDTVTALRRQGTLVAWVHIGDYKSTPLIKRSTKTDLILKFVDLSWSWSMKDDEDLFTKQQAQRLKRFLCNLHYNSTKPFVLVVNCNAGQSRSPAVGEWCESKFNVPVEFLEPPHTISPNTRVLAMLGK